jgi:deoxycytidylate deaminase
MSNYLSMALDFNRSHEYDADLPAFVSAVVVQGGRVLAVGYNRRASSGLQERYRVNEYCCTVHAEVDAVLSVRRKIDLTGSKIYVARRHKLDKVTNPSVVLSRPCAMCQSILHAYGIKKAYYTISNTEFGCMKIISPKLIPADEFYNTDIQ